MGMIKDVFDEYGNYKYPDYANSQYTHDVSTTGGVMMEMTIDNDYIQQGWQCPICKRVYSPTTMMCMYCGGELKTTITTSSTVASRAIKMSDWDWEKKDD